MIGLVIVSHSAQIAEGTAEMARNVAGPEVRIGAAGGLDLPGRPLGTDAMLILAAIEQVYGDDGVLVLMDLGSAVMSAELALDLLGPDRRARVALCAAPLVEGAIAAAVQARLGSPLESVMREALNALTPKQQHLAARSDSSSGNSSANSAPQPESESRSAPTSHTMRLVVSNRHGLHARPAARLVQLAARFEADVRIANLTTGRGPVSARSINAVATLGARQGHEIEIAAAGPDAQAALAALDALARQNFGDVDAELEAATRAGVPTPATAQPPLVEGATLHGIPASPGVAVGPARLMRAALVAAPITATLADDPEAQWELLRTAIERTRAAIRAARAAASGPAAAIFEAHLLFLDDEALLAPARRALLEQSLSAAAAWQRAVQSVAAEYHALEDEYQRSRAADVLEVGQQVLANLPGQAVLRPTIGSDTLPGILVVNELTAADAVYLDPERVYGVCAASGGATSHAVILARALEIPMVVGVDVSSIAEGTLLVLDGDSGQIITAPDERTRGEYAQRADRRRALRAEMWASSAADAVTRDGRRVEVAANISTVGEAALALRAGAEGVGVLRTEFLFVDRQAAPTEDEQYTAYRAIAQALEGRPLIIRTLDVGGDKPLPYLDQGREANPFLGWRAIRLCLAQPELFKTQLRAAIRTAAEFPTRLMFPMIATPDEFWAAKGLLHEASAELRARGVPVPDYIETGIMVEIPSTALCAAAFATEVDFFSIGTNDLTQYTLAAERGNPRLAALNDSFQPAVLRLIRLVAEAAHQQRKWAGVCGEMAGDPLAVPLLIGLGIDELSMNAAAIPRVKHIVRALDSASVHDWAEGVLTLNSAAAVRSACSDYLATLEA